MSPYRKAVGSGGIRRGEEYTGIRMEVPAAKLERWIRLLDMIETS